MKGNLGKFCVLLKSKIDVYARFIFFKGMSGFAFTAGLFLFYPNELLPSYYLIFLVQEFYFSYYLTMQRNRLMNGDIQEGILSTTLLLSVLIGGGVFFFLEKPMADSDLFLFYLSVLLFPIYASSAIVLEKRNINEWVKVESNSIFLSSVFTFIMLAAFWIINDEVWGGVIFLRFLLFFLISFFWGRRIVIDYKLESPYCSFSAMVSQFKGVDVVLLLFVLKYVYFSIYNSEFEEVGGAGASIKYFMVAYDFLAAVAGLYIRRSIALNQKDKEFQNKSVMKAVGYILFFAILGCGIVEGQVKAIYTLSFFAVSALLFSCLDFNFSIAGIIERLILAVAIVLMQFLDSYYCSAICLTVFLVIYTKNRYA